MSKAFEPCNSKGDEYGVLLFVALIQYANLEVDLAILFLCRHPISLCEHNETNKMYKVSNLITYLDIA
jgi:hypothetical protein